MMTLGLSLSAFTLLHVVISLVGIASGIVVSAQLLKTRWSGRWHNLFLWTTLATTVTGFMFPISALTPALIVGAISAVALAIALWAYYRLGRARIYVPAALFALYLNSFVLVVQAFQKVGLLNALAPTQTELPFIIAQGLVLAMFGLATIVIWLRNAGGVSERLGSEAKPARVMAP
jgi:hypothetical protein